MNNPEFTLTYKEYSYRGQSFFKDWNKSPNDQIQSLKFCFGGLTIVLENYRYYNHLVEHVVGLKKNHTITKILIMGRKDKTCDVFEFNIDDKKFKRYIRKIGEEYSGIVTSGWKEGLKEGKAKFYYVK